MWMYLNIRKGMNQKMASSLFSRHDASKRRWNKIKSDPELYEKQLAYQRKKYSTYNEEQKLNIKEKQKVWRLSMRKIAKDIGNCSMCFKEKDSSKFKICSKCRERMRGYQNKYYLKKKKEMKGGIQNQYDKDITNTNSNL
jgi:hypothetical protein